MICTLIARFNFVINFLIVQLTQHVFGLYQSICHSCQSICDNPAGNLWSHHQITSHKKTGKKNQPGMFDICGAWVHPVIFDMKLICTCKPSVISTIWAPGGSTHLVRLSHYILNLHIVIILSSQITLNRPLGHFYQVPGHF